MSVTQLSVTVARTLVITLAIAACSTPTTDLPKAGPSKTGQLKTDTARPRLPAVTGTPAAAPTASEGDRAKPSQPPAEPSQLPAHNVSGQPAASPKLEASAPAAPGKVEVKTAPTQIAINASVCGAGGQAAYFETKSQAIYICRSENQSLTYIATPKKQGNSIFLPATAIPDGDETAYMAEDGARRFLIGPVGYRLEENGKAIAQEKVIRDRQFP
ncbi:MAG: hypothetical protein HC857_11415 [Synechococcales cyanobacterium RU_4_20]|nr:hypothetical protein [Synechococcales cyanobacterium RU_4_20]NJR67667.1 hypothetical protein [Synechococcales cyanobacterium CRU_2_2]